MSGDVRWGVFGYDPLTRMSWDNFPIIAFRYERSTRRWLRKHPEYAHCEVRSYRWRDYRCQ